MPRRNQHQGTSEPLLATIGANTQTDLEVLAAFAEAGTPFITVTSFADALVDAHSFFEDAAEVEHRLRQLTARGWLIMSAYRDPATNEFIEYRWMAS